MWIFTILYRNTNILIFLLKFQQNLILMTGWSTTAFCSQCRDSPPAKVYVFGLQRNATENQHANSKHTEVEYESALSHHDSFLLLTLHQFYFINSKVIHNFSKCVCLSHKSKLYLQYWQLSVSSFTICLFGGIIKRNEIGF